MSFHPATVAAFFDEMQKIASEEGEEKKPSAAWNTAKVVGAGTLGFGLGTAGGLLAGHGMNKAYQMATGKEIPMGAINVAAPLLGTASGIAYAVYKAREQEAIRRALENKTSTGAG